MVIKLKEEIEEMDESEIERSVNASMLTRFWYPCIWVCEIIAYTNKTNCQVDNLKRKVENSKSGTDIM